MTSVDPSLEPTVITDPRALRFARDAGLVAAEILGYPGVLSTAVLHAPEAPTVHVRAQTLAVAYELAVAFDLTWHSQGTGKGAGALYVHAFEGLYAAMLPVTVYALGNRVYDPEVGTLDGLCAVPLILAGTLL
jgi:hypothetical protein